MNENKRLLSLDVLRGLDLFLLVALQPVVVAALRQLNCEALNDTLLYQLDHAEWEGLRLWDMVMPLFLFMSGVTMPYSLPKYKTQNGNLKVWVRVVKRFLLLFLLGMLVQGNILALDPNRVYIYSNTLQAIAVGYLLAVPMVLYLSPKWQIVAIVALLVLYSVPRRLERAGQFCRYCRQGSAWAFPRWQCGNSRWRSAICCVVRLLLAVEQPHILLYCGAWKPCRVFDEKWQR